ncbi:MAG TPA: hypothetical protein VIM29_11485 [Bacillota bacterium]
MLNRRGQILSLNKSAAQLFGVTATRRINDTSRH